MGYNISMRSLLIAALLFAISIRAQDLRPYGLPAEIGTQVRALTAAEPLRLLAGIASLNLQLRSAAEGKWDELDPRAQCALVRAGLRSGELRQYREAIGQLMRRGDPEA